MIVGAVDLDGVWDGRTGDLEGLSALTQPLVSQPFLFARSSYGDELTVHFGTLREVTSPKLKRRHRGSFVLTVRGSFWQIESGSGEQLLLGFPQDVDAFSKDWLKPLTLSMLEHLPSIAPNSLVVSVRPFADPESGGFGLYLAFSDQSRVVIRPDVSDLIAEADPDLPRLADWELFTPHDRVLRVGPGANWSYTPSK